METSYEIPNLENQNKMSVPAQSHFLPNHNWKVYKEKRNFSRANFKKISRISYQYRQLGDT